MRKMLPLLALFFAYGCQQNVVVPTAKELIASPPLFAELRAKCKTGMYSQLPADQKANMCTTTENAIVSVAQIKAGNEEADFFNANTIRKN